MSAIVGLLQSGDRALLDRDANSCLLAMRARGDRVRTLHAEGASVGASHFEWETDLLVVDPDRIARVGDVVVAADATLYYVDDLRRDLRSSGVDASGTTVAHLIAAAYHAWGDDCVHHLEGDFAFILYDSARRRMLCARDFAGRRSLYFARLGATLVVASSVPGVLAHHECPRDLDLVSLGSCAAFLFAQDSETPYRAIKSMRAGARLTCLAGQKPHEETYWQFPALNERVTGGFDEAAEELRELLGHAVQERLALTGPTALWMSGGYDSPALFGAGQLRLHELQQEDRLRVVSISYPPGDPGREDELIADIAARWSVPVHWIDIGNVPMLEHLPEFAARGDEPFVHAFEAIMRALLSGARDVGARVGLLGDGGDQLFAVSTIFMLDLFAQLRWKELAREWQAFGPQGYRAFFDRIVLPVARSVAQRGRPDARSLMHQPPPWIREDFLRTHHLVARELEGEIRLRPDGLSRASIETVRSVRYPMISKVNAAYSAFALESGIEMRVPLLDQRIVNFAARRPRSDRASGGEVKRLLRRSMQGLLPESVLAPRKNKTGVVGGYFERSLRADSSGIVEEAFREPLLGQLGIVEPKRLREEWHHFCRNGGGGKGFKLFLTLQVELWVRSRLTDTRSVHSIPV